MSSASKRLHGIVSIAGTALIGSATSVQVGMGSEAPQWLGGIAVAGFTLLLIGFAMFAFTLEGPDAKQTAHDSHDRYQKTRVLSGALPPPKEWNQMIPTTSGILVRIAIAGFVLTIGSPPDSWQGLVIPAATVCVMITAGMLRMSPAFESGGYVAVQALRGLLATTAIATFSIAVTRLAAGQPTLGLWLSTVAASAAAIALAGGAYLMHHKIDIGKGSCLEETRP